MSCVFCSVADKRIPARIIRETDKLVAFHDINAQAPVHILVIPRKHIPTINDVDANDASLIGEMVLMAKEIMEEQGYDQKGYRLVLNCNNDGGQTVYHLHLHVLAGRFMTWPPG